MSAVVVVQRLLTRWEKSGRAHPVASVRNSLPTALELPSTILGGPVAYHAVAFDQRTNFAPRITHEETRAAPPRHDCGLSVSSQHGHLVASFQWAQDCGAPMRNAGLSKKLFDLAVGEFGRVVHNRRFAPEYSWTYQQVIVNVGLFEPATVGSFLDAQPVAEADLRADLW